MKRVYNFNAGPAALPFAVLQRAQEEFLNFKDSGMALMELSHRSKEYDQVHEKAISDLKELYHIPDDYEVLFLQGGASLQFAMIPMNFLPENKIANYSLTGTWSEKALAEAEKFGKTAIISSSKESKYNHIPDSSELIPTDDAAYVHITSNNTIYGTQWSDYPDLGNIPLIADMSSDILSKEIDIRKFDMIYAGAQKNLGPSGVTVVILKKDLLKNIPSEIPTLLNYQTHVKNNSLYNTPPTFSIYILSLVLDWVREQGGVSAIERINNEKAELLYNCIDQSNGFYKAHAQVGSRSKMNVTFTLPTEQLTKDFLAQSKELGFVGLGGHRSIGGCRASIYNAVPLESCVALVNFMKDFRYRN
ncbi:3-phosphoserine/phosphohydroxythreonine transaminase [Bacillus sp. PS06]|uniref:3-phosphoserine/phosphohydroxythreonine transaminase n=1 Tax=Bacillus sp. PS06 TaxID=2764176 RepID=UPI00177C7A57|nr:3-phosphoserine/phosphohydroxythreonine transaminase [Bacillus sp. PS06]MBD8067718.1 3-phosphoserine/phosphohydroxythreonine transaminase [Bacillus sp. PS06]